MAIEDLELFVGTWNTTGEIEAAPGQPALRLVATDTYRWLAGGRFLLHEVDARLGEAATRSLEIIGWDDAAGHFVTRSYDDRGGIEDFTARLGDRRWQIFGDDARFDGTFGPDGGLLSGKWERRDAAGDWQSWMKIELKRAY